MFSHIVRTNTKISKNDQFGIVPCIQNGYDAAPAIALLIDYSEFSKGPAEREQLSNMKRANIAERREAYGSCYKNYLNIPKRTIGKSIHIQF